MTPSHYRKSLPLRYALVGGGATLLSSGFFYDRVQAEEVNISGTRIDFSIDEIDDAYAKCKAISGSAGVSNPLSGGGLGASVDTELSSIDCEEVIKLAEDLSISSRLKAGTLEGGVSVGADGINGELGAKIISASLGVNAGPIGAEVEGYVGVGVTGGVSLKEKDG